MGLSGKVQYDPCRLYILEEAIVAVLWEGEPGEGGEVAGGAPWRVSLTTRPGHADANATLTLLDRLSPTAARRIRAEVLGSAEVKRRGFSSPHSAGHVIVVVRAHGERRLANLGAALAALRAPLGSGGGHQSGTCAARS